MQQYVVCRSSCSMYWKKKEKWCDLELSPSWAVPAHEEHAFVDCVLGWMQPWIETQLYVVFKMIIDYETWLFSCPGYFSNLLSASSLNASPVRIKKTNEWSSRKCRKRSHICLCVVVLFLLTAYQCGSYGTRFDVRRTCSCISWRCWWSRSQPPPDSDWSQPEEGTNVKGIIYIYISLNPSVKSG